MKIVKYNIYLRIVHWVMAAAIIGLIASGWYMEGIDPKAPDKYDLYPWHKSFGMMVLIFFFVRIVLRFRTHIPELPDGIKGIEALASHVVHLILYVFMLIVPVSGYIMSVAGGHGVKLFSLRVPELFEKNKELAGLARELHGIFPYILLGILVVHILGALKHRFFDKPENDVLCRMV